MAYVSKVLLDGERVETRPRFSRFAEYGAPTVEFALALGSWLLLRAVLAPWLTPTDPVIQAAARYAFIAGVVIFTARWAFRMIRRAVTLWFRELAVTDRRFMEKSGVFTVSFFATDLEKIVRVEIEQPLLGRVFDYGHVTIVTLGEVRHVTERVAGPIALQQALHERMTRGTHSPADGAPQALPQATSTDPAALPAPPAREPAVH